MWRIVRVGGLQLIPLAYVNECAALLRGYLAHQPASRIDPGDAVLLRGVLDYYVNTWLDTYLGMDFFTASDLETNRTNNYTETYHGRQKEHFTQKHPPLGLFIFENRRLLNHQEFYAKRVARGMIAPPEKEDGAIAEVKVHLTEQLALDLTPEERSAVLLKALYNLGRLAGMSADL